MRFLNTLTIRCIIFFVLVVAFACQQKKNDMAYHSISDTTKVKVSNFVQKYFLSKYAYLTRRAAKDSSELSEHFANSSLRDSTMKQLDRQMGKGSTTTFEYTSSSVTVFVVDSTAMQKGDTIKFLVRVSYQLVTNSRDIETDSVIVSRGVELHSLQIVQRDQTYLVTSDVVDNTIEIPVVAMSRISPQSESTTAILSYNPDGAIRFARQHWEVPPTSGYTDYTTQGGDCTNFISHALKSGGWQMVNEWHWLRDGTSCDQNMTTCVRSPSWTGADPFNKFVLNAGASRVILQVNGLDIPRLYWDDSDYDMIKQLEKGDIIQLSRGSSSQITHSMIVTSKTATEPFIFFAQRNSDCPACSVCYDRPISELTSLFFAGEIYGFRVKR